MRRGLSRQISKSSDELNSAEAVRRRSVPARLEVHGRAPSLDTAIDEERSEDNSCLEMSAASSIRSELDRWNGVLLRNSFLFVLCRLVLTILLSS